MSNLSLTLSIILSMAIAAGVLAVYDRSNGQVGTLARVRLGVFLAAALVMVSTVGIYLMTGHYADWMDQRVDESKDYQLAAKITAARKEVADEPNNIQLKVNLANLYLQGGLFNEAVNTTEEAISQAGEKPSLLGLLANAMYYRDGRKLNEDALQTIDKALKQDNFEVTSRMLLAEAAFRHGEYQKAIEQWQLLLDSNVAPDHANAFHNAIANAKNRLAQKETN